MTTILIAAILAQPVPCATTGPRIVRHDAMASVFALHPERRIPNLWPIATDNCADLGKRMWLVVGDDTFPVYVADCARADDVPYRRRMGYAADVDRMLWEHEGWPYCPVAAYLLPFAWKDFVQ